ncbi:hypothetical protein ID866_12248 [Astraeus odoratus]|nr:hypothetical protein ID866_12248 [Astraeus odoratus]
MQVLTKTYKCHAVKLHTTENGVQEDGDVDGFDSEEFCNFYIGADGPNEGTSLEAKNIWIIKEFPFFPELHRIFVACPNVTPSAVTTEDALNYAQAQTSNNMARDDTIALSQTPSEKENFFSKM